jgi:DNA-binding transcriptional regulator YhcF (GntR family)
VLATLRRLVAERADAGQRLAAMRALATHTERSPDPVYRAYQLKLGEYNCDFAARIHNATTPAQRLKARETLKGWEDDVRALIAP